MKKHAAAVLLLGVVAMVGSACASKVVAGSGGAAPSGDCTTNTDCSGGACVEVTPGGYKVCVHTVPEATTCQSPMSMLDKCCTSADCKSGGKCYDTSTLPQCSGPAMAIYNECLSDQCTSDTMCATSKGPPQICAPAGAFGFPARACFTAYCKTHADCTAQPGGACMPVGQPCCSGPAGLACVYPGGCSKASDCGMSGACQINPTTGAGECTTMVGCPV